MTCGIDTSSRDLRPRPIFTFHRLAASQLCPPQSEGFPFPASTVAQHLHSIFCFRKGEMLPFFFFFSYTLLSLALLASQTTALPRRYPSDLFSSLFSSSHHAENSRFRAAIPQHPFIAATTINTVFTHPYPQQCPLSPPALAHDLAADQHPRSPLPTAQNPSDARHSDKTDYSRACNLGYRISSLEEDAAEIASVQCQGGTVKRIVVVAASASASSSSVSTKAEEGDDTVAKSQSQSSLSPSEEDEVWECVACPMGI